MNYTITKHTTTQGLPVWLVDTPDATTIQTTIAVRAGYEYAGDARIYEVPRIVQHVLTQTMEDDHIDASAHIYQDWLQHFVAYSLQAESAPQFATKLSHIIRSLYQTGITRSTFQAAKKRTLAELAKEERDIDAALMSDNQYQMFGRPKLAQRTQSATDISLRDAQRFYGMFYTLANSDIVITANMHAPDWDETVILQAIEKACEGAAIGQRFSLYQLSRLKTITQQGRYGSIIVPRDSAKFLQNEDSSYTIGFHGFRLNSVQNPLMEISIRILIECILVLFTAPKWHEDSFKDHPLYQAQCEAKYCRLFNMFVGETGQSYRFMIHYIVDDNNMPLFEEKLWQGLQKLANEGAPQEVFKIARQAVLWRINNETKTAEQFHQWVTRQIIKRFDDKQPIVSSDDLIKACRQIHPQTVTNTAKASLLKNAVFNTHITIEDHHQAIAKTIYNATQPVLLDYNDLIREGIAKEVRHDDAPDKNT
ncbi:MAG: hypothetical protein D8B38_04575 [Candidatus Saccharimonas sp.]|nr:MAG: hypothetical protein D8B38_04575 [Candidatus Saccharimonas sp.]